MLKSPAHYAGAMRAMRWFAVTLAFVLAAGCADTTTDDAEAPPVDEPEPVRMKEGFEASGQFLLSADVTNVVGMGICSAPMAECHSVPFTIEKGEAPVALKATLAWGLPANDLDMYLYADGAEISNDGINFLGDPPTNSQVMQVAELDAGDYEFIIVGWNAVAESYTLSVTFE